MSWVHFLPISSLLGTAKQKLKCSRIIISVFISFCKRKLTYVYIQVAYKKPKQNVVRNYWQNRVFQNKSKFHFHIIYEHYLIITQIDRRRYDVLLLRYKVSTCALCVAQNTWKRYFTFCNTWNQNDEWWVLGPTGFVMQTLNSWSLAGRGGI